MKLLVIFTTLVISSHSQAQSLNSDGYYRTGEFFEEYNRLKTEAIKMRKPIVLLAGFKGCIGCDDLKLKMEKNKSTYDKAAFYMPISIKDQVSRFFYTTLGIKQISSAPQSFLINPLTGKVKKVNAFEVKEILKLSKTIKWKRQKNSPASAS